MLHIILGILKVIGIIAGILVLLVLGALLALFLVPVRYRLEAAKDPQRLSAGVRLSWLLHAVSAELTVRPPGDRTIAVRLFGIRLPLFGDGAERSGRTENPGRTKKKGGRKRTAKDAAEPPADRAESAAESKVQEDPKQETAEADQVEPEAQENQEQKTAEPKVQENPKQKAAKACQVEPEVQESQEQETAEADRAEAEAPEGQEPWTETAAEPDEPEQEAVKRGPGIFRKIWFSCRNFYVKIKKILQILQSLPRKYAAFRKRAAGFFQKAINLAQRPGQLLEMAEEYELREILGGLTGQLFYLLAHYRPRRIRGYLKFGTGDPATTGWLTGLIYLLLPARADQFTVSPDFYTKMFETEFICEGHIRALHLLRVLLRVVPDKKVQRLIKKLRKRGNGHG